MSVSSGGQLIATGHESGAVNIWKMVKSLSEVNSSKGIVVNSLKYFYMMFVASR